MSCLQLGACRVNLQDLDLRNTLLGIVLQEECVAILVVSSKTSDSEKGPTRASVQAHDSLVFTVAVAVCLISLYLSKTETPGSVVGSIWGFPKMGDPDIVLEIVGSLL